MNSKFDKEDAKLMIYSLSKYFGSHDYDTNIIDFLLEPIIPDILNMNSRSLLQFVQNLAISRYAPPIHNNQPN